MTRPDVVVDASALVFAGTNDSAPARALRNRLSASTVHAPHLVDAEVGQTLRGLLLARQIDLGMADRLRIQLPGLVEERYDHRGRLSQRAWAHRNDVTFYDGLYVALAVELGCVLVTTDGRLSRAPALECPLEVVR